VGFSKTGVLLSFKNEAITNRKMHDSQGFHRYTIGVKPVVWEVIMLCSSLHGWECGYLLEQQTRTLLCGDLFTQGGAALPVITTADILAPSEAFRQGADYYSHTKNVHALCEKLATPAPTTLACMHGSVWQGDGAALLRALAETLAKS
jgi:hypothetical protein